MPLLDHFHNPTKRRIPWPTMAQAWAVSLMGWLNRHLPRSEFRAEVNLRLGQHVEADVAELEEMDLFPGSSANGVVATLEAPPAVFTLEAIFPDDLEIEIKEERDRSRIVGVIELVSPGNKDRQSERDAFVAKCVTYLRRGIGVVVIDIVTDRSANLHNELIKAIAPTGSPDLGDHPIYVAGYRPVHRRDSNQNQIEVWPYLAKLGERVPAVPFGLKRGPTILLDLETTYTSAIESTGL